MEKIKIFIRHAHEHSKLQDEINEFIVDKDVIDVQQSITDFGFSNGTRKMHIMFTVRYRQS